MVRQTSMASGQRGWNGQPGGVDPARGVSPGRMIRDRRAAASTSGTAERSASVYGCAGRASSVAGGPGLRDPAQVEHAVCSHSPGTIARLWVISR